MANEADDLKRYLRDEMTPAERHAFEKRALDDPFLRDAISGSETVTPEAFVQDVDELNRRFAQSGTPLFTPIRIAAGILLVATVGWLVYQTTPAEPESLADLKKDSTAALTDSTSKLLTLATPKKDSSAESDKKDPSKSIASAPAVKPSEQRQTLAQPAPTSTAGQSASGAVARTEPAKTDLPAEARAKESVAKAGLAKEEGAKTETAKTEVADVRRDESLPVSEPTPSAFQKKAAVARPQAVTGTLREAEQGLPLRKSDASQAQDVVLTDDAARKSEVLVFPSDSSASNAPIVLAAPAGGLEAYGRYLEENQRVPEAARAARIHGKVTVSFEVSATGNMSGYRVVKSLGYGCDEELQRLIHTGPAWTATVKNGKPQASTVVVKLEFAADR